MRLALFATLAVITGGLPSAQEREVPKDSVRITVPGCARGRLFVVGPRSEHEPGRSDIAPGRRFRLAGNKDALAEIRKREASMVQLTGLIRRSDVNPPGISLGGGVRISPGMPPTTSSPGRNSGFDEVVFDVESWQPLPGSCPAK